MPTCLAAICLAAGTFYAVDADTLGRPDAPNLRIWGVNAEEQGHPEYIPARAAMDALTRGQSLACDEMDRDRYGRIVARCDLTSGPYEGLDIACAMVALGWAEDWPRYSRGAYQRCERGRP